MDIDAVRAFALGLAESIEAPHHDRSSFRVAGKIFATVAPDEVTVNVFVDEDQGREAIAESSSCEELWWGKKLSGVRVELSAVPVQLMEELLVDAWRRKAPKALVAAYDGQDISRT